MATLNKENIFLPSGCLKWEAMQNYQQGGFSNEVRIAIAAHIETCSFCHEALDGLSLMSQSMEQDTYLNSLKEEVNSTVQNKILSTKRKSKSFEKIGLLAAAASILMLTGVFSIYTYLQKQDNELIAEESYTKTIREETNPSEYKVKRNDSSDAQANSIPVKPTDILLVEDDLQNDDPLTISDVDEEFQIISENEKLPKVAGIVTDTGLLIDNLDLKSTETRNMKIEDQETANPALASSKKQNKVLQKGARSANSRPDVKSEDMIIIDGVEASVPPRFESNKYESFDDYISSNLKYPPEDFSEGKEAEVVVEFIISQTGNIKNVQIIEGAETEFNQEAIRLISDSPDWKPAYSNGLATDHKMKWTIYFRIKDSK